MEELLHGLLENSSIPVVSAIALGLMTAISPCPLATNITAIGYIGKDISNKNRVFVNGLIYTLGRALSYTILAVIIFIGADQFKISGWFQLYGEKDYRSPADHYRFDHAWPSQNPFPGFSNLPNDIRQKG